MTDIYQELDLYKRRRSFLVFVFLGGGSRLDSQREGENITHSLLTKFPGKAVEWSLISGNFPKLEGFFLKENLYTT